MKSNWPALGWQLYISAARLSLGAPSFQSGRLADSQPAKSACSPRRAFHPAASALLLLTNIHPAWSACQTQHPHPPLPIPSSSHLPPLFLRSTELVKVSQSPVALLYRLRCFLFKWRQLSLVNTHAKSGRAPPRLPPPPPFVWLFWRFIAHLSLDVCII